MQCSMGASSIMISLMETMETTYEGLAIGDDWEDGKLFVWTEMTLVDGYWRVGVEMCF